MVTQSAILSGVSRGWCASLPADALIPIDLLPGGIQYGARKRVLHGVNEINLLLICWFRCQYWQLAAFNRATITLREVQLELELGLYGVCVI